MWRRSLPATRSAPAVARRTLASQGAPVSRRGAAAPGLLPTYLKDARGVQTYDPVLRPNGVLQLSVAENQMVGSLLTPKLKSIQAEPYKQDGTQGLFDRSLIFYQQTNGMPECRAAIAQHMTRVLNNHEYTFDPELLVVGAGCNAVLENLIFAIADEGEGVLIPRPYYAAFEFDLQARAAVQVLPVALSAPDSFDGSDFDQSWRPVAKSGGRGAVHTGDETALEASSGAVAPAHAAHVSPEQYYPTPETLEAAYQSAMDAGVTPRVLLLSSPNNPLGICYPEDVLLKCWEWCESKDNLHLVSDEIYGGSIWGDAHQPAWRGFGAIAARAGKPMGDRLHVIWALSKDFALSGLRVGAVYTENMHIQAPLQKLNDLCQVGSTTQVMVSRLLAQPHDGLGFAEALQHGNQAWLRGRYERLTAVLGQHGVPYLPAGAGLFVWIDLRAWLPPPSESSTPDVLRAESPVGIGGALLPPSEAERERFLYLRLIREFGLLLTPGVSMRTEEPGYFRCVFSAASDQAFELALRRFAKLGASPRRS